MPATTKIKYNGFDEYIDAQNAFVHTIGIREDIFVSNVAIRINGTCPDGRPPINVMGSCTPDGAINSPGAPMQPFKGDVIGY